MNKCRILLFAGTTEGRRLAEYLGKQNVRVHVCVATAYGESLIQESKSMSVSHERMDVNEMMSFMREFRPDYVVDATHPFASEVTQNIRSACTQCQHPYIRLLRDETQVQGFVSYVDSVENAVEQLQETEGNILVTTGSKALAAYTKLKDYKERVYARVLSVKASVESCEMLGITGKHLICMQGPFSVEMNKALLNDYKISWMVTKESGKNGGFLEKVEACEATGTKLLVIGRPKEKNGHSYHEVCQYLREQFDLEAAWQVTLAGIGMGTKDSMTEAVQKAIDEADLVIGAKRMMEVVPKQKARLISYKPEEILDYIKAHPEYEKVIVLFSGDIGFYSGAKKLRELLETEKNIEVRVIPGISSGIYLCDKIGVSWENVHFLSRHGRECYIVSEVRTHEKVVMLAGNVEGIKEVMRELTDYGYGKLSVVIGCHLGYENEQIYKGDAENFCDYEGDALAVVYIENPKAKEDYQMPGISDDVWIRSKVPMTKEEVRCVSLSKMRLKKEMTVYDVGAGTGSVAIEAALQIPEGHVYAIERKAEALELLEKNKKKFGTDNLTVIAGEAPEAILNLPMPDVVFIGGSGGHMEAILNCVCEKNPKVRIVLNAIALETVAEVLAFLKKKKIDNAEVVQLQVSKGRLTGPYHMMQGQNPIYIISFSCQGEENEEKSTTIAH